MRELRDTLPAQPCERRHRRARVHRLRVLDVSDLEVDAFVLGAFGRQIGSAEVVTAVAEVRVAVETTRDSEQLRARDRLLVVREALLLRPARDVPEQLGP